MKLVDAKEHETNPAYSKRSTRRTWNYGYSFFHLEDGGLPKYNEIPQWLEAVVTDVVNIYNYRLPQDFKVDNILIADYQAGECVTPHFDFALDNSPHEGTYPYSKADTNFGYGDVVLGLIIQPDEEGSLYWVRSEETKSLPDAHAKAIFTLKEEEGQTYLFDGPLRRHPWYHAVSECKKRRISITFRQTLFKQKLL